jgi:uncharacterized protein
MSIEPLTEDEKSRLLIIARESIEAAVNRRRPPALDLPSMPIGLREKGASFVTLTGEGGRLRGCIGALEAYQSLAEDVSEHAAAAAMEDYRFVPVAPREVARLHIEVSRLTPPVPLEYDRPEDLPLRLHPGVDGVILKDGPKRATFLPQVWDQLATPEEFLSHLCEKMGAPSNLWCKKKLLVLLYQVEEFQEE